MLAISIASLHLDNALVNLAVNIRLREAATRAEAAIVAKYTATSCYGAIDVRTSESSIDAHLLHPKAELAAQKEVIGKVTETGLAPGGSRLNRRNYFG